MSVCPSLFELTNMSLCHFLASNSGMIICKENPRKSNIFVFLKESN